MTSSNGNIFRVAGPLCVEFTGHRWIPFKKARDAERWCFFDLRLNKGLSKQLMRRWFETRSAHYDVSVMEIEIRFVLSIIGKQPPPVQGKDIIPGCESLAHWGQDKMVDILRTTFSNAFSLMKIGVFWFNYHRNFPPRVQSTMSQHCFR